MNAVLSSFGRLTSVAESVQLTEKVFCRNLDVEALRAAERRHAEARIRATFDDIKQKAFHDVMQRLNSSSDGAVRQSSTLRSALSGADSIQGTPKHAHTQQPMQHFNSSAPVSQMVSQLRSNIGMERLSNSSLPKQGLSRFARPPKAAGSHVQIARQISGRSDVQSDGGQGLHRAPLSTHNANVASGKLMRLTSCIKLDKSSLRNN